MFLLLLGVIFVCLFFVISLYCVFLLLFVRISCCLVVWCFVCIGLCLYYLVCTIIDLALFVIVEECECVCVRNCIMKCVLCVLCFNVHW